MVSNKVFLNTFAQTACFGREKEVGDPTSKASADLSDFLALIFWSRLTSRSHGRTSTSWSC